MADPKDRSSYFKNKGKDGAVSICMLSSYNSIIRIAQYW